MPKALFLDRDGTINVDKGYVHKIEDFRFIDGIFDLCRAARDKGFEIIVCTNQSGIARGYFTEADFQKITAYMLDRFSEQGIAITAVFHCPALDGADRKPNTGMFVKARDQYGIDMAASISLGDSERDVIAGINAGVGKNYLLSAKKVSDPVCPVVSSCRKLAEILREDVQ